MGQTVEINEDNIESFRDLLGEDVAENIGREYFYALAADNPLGDSETAVVWRLKNADGLGNTEAEITFFSVADEEEGEEILQDYTEKISEDDVVRSYFEFDEVTEEMRSQLTEAGFEINDCESRDLYGTLEALANIKALSKKKVPPYIAPLSSIQPLQFMQGVTNCMFFGRVGLEEDLAMLPMDWYEQDVSCCMITDGKINGFFLIHLKPSGILMPVLLYASGIDANKNMLEMLRFSLHAAIERYSADTRVLICRHDDKTRALSAYLFPQEKGKMIVGGERAEGE